MGLIKVEELNRVVNGFTEKFGLRAELGEDFAYYPESEVVTYSLLINERADRTFSTFLRKNFPDIEADLFLWSLLHEVGHHMTIDQWEENEQDEFDERKDRLSLLYREEVDGSEEEIDNLFYDYYKTPDEFEATSWAADYMRENPEEVEKFNCEMKDMLMHFFFLNDIH